MTWTTCRPIGGRVLIKLDARRSQLGSIFVPDDHQRQPESATIVAVGRLAPPELKPGTRIVIGKYNGAQIPSPDHDPTGEYYILDCDYSKRGQKLAVPTQGYTHAPYLPDVYGVVEAEAGEDVSERVSSDAVKRMPHAG